MRQPVLLQVLPALESGGVERGTVDIARAASQAGFVSLVASAGGKMVPQLQEAGAEHIFLPLTEKSPFRLYANYRILKKMIQERNISIVHARSRAPAWSAYYAARDTGTHFITTFHGMYSLGFPGKRLYNSIMARGEKVIAISGQVKEHLMQEYAVPEERIVRIFRGVDLEAFNPESVSEERKVALATRWKLRPGVPVVFLPGRITRWKGQDFLLSALSELRDAEFQCIIAGHTGKHGGYQQELDNFIETNGLQGSVQLVDAVSDMPAAYALSSVVVSASLRPEAFGRVAVEAQAMGVPVVATDIGGSRETVLQGKTGFLVETKNPHAMAQAVLRVLTMREMERAAFAQAARAHVAEHFSLAGMCAQTLGVYQNLLGAHD